MKNSKQKGNVGVMLLVIVVVIVGGYFYQKKNVSQEIDPVVNDVKDQASVGAASERLLAFEEAINNKNWVEAQKYLASEVWVELEGSSCCGTTSASKVVSDLNAGNFKDILLTFDNNSQVVKEFHAYNDSQYPSGRKVGPQNSRVDFSNLVFGVENNTEKEYKAVLGYYTQDGKITILFKSPVGR